MTVRIAGRARLGAFATVFAAVFALVAVTTSVIATQTLSPSRALADDASCTSGSVYSLGGAGHIYSMDTGTAARTLVGTLPAGPSYNGLAITDDGSAMYAVNQSGSGSSTVYEFDPNTDTATSFTGPDPVGSYSFVMGGINPVTGIYYMGTPTATGVDIYAFDTATNTAIAGRVARVSGLVGGSAGGDLVFDSTGRMYIVFSLGDGSPTANQLVRVDQMMPVTDSDSALTATLLTDLLPTTSSFNGVTFDGDGYLYLSSASTLTKLNPDTGAVVSSTSIPSTVDGDSTDDLADCQYNGQLQLRADVVGRYRGSADQFGLSITGGGVSSGNAATTSGTTTGAQTDPASTAGPVIGLAGTTYQIHQTATSGSLADYTVAASCIDTGNGEAPIALTPTTAGSTSDYSFDFPDASGSQPPTLACTFTDTPIPSAAITVTEALAGARIADSDQFIAEIRSTSPVGPVVSAGANATTTGSGSAVDAGTGTTGGFISVPGSTYYVTQEASGSTDLSAYDTTITCTDAAGLQPDLPDGLAFTGSVAITPVDGAAIDCVLSEGVQRYTVSVSTSAPTAAPGTVITYTVTVTNNGQVAYTGASPASFTDDLTGVGDDAIYIPGSATVTAGLLQLTDSQVSWRGALAPGATIVARFAVRVDTPDAGDHLLVNQVAVGGVGGACISGCATSTPVQDFSVSVSGSSTSIAPGDLITFTIIVTNVGQLGYPASAAASFSDDLSGITDDATLIADSATASSGTVLLSGSTLTWSGPLPLPPAATSMAVITFQAQVNDPDTGDHSLSTLLLPAGPGAGDIVTAPGGSDIAVESFALRKTVSVVRDGSRLTAHYAVTVTNTGTEAYTATFPAAFTDDLTGALDDARYDNDGSAGVTFAAPTLSWSGSVAVGAAVTVTWSMTIKYPDTGDGQLLDAMATSTASGGSCGTVSPVAVASGTNCGAEPVELAAGELAFTGLDIQALVELAVLSLIAGMSVLLLGRERRRALVRKQ